MRKDYIRKNYIIKNYIKMEFYYTKRDYIEKKLYETI